MRTASAVVAISSLVTLVPSSASAQAAKQAVAMQVWTNFVPSTTRCALDSFVAAGPALQPEAGSTICAIGGPFGAGIVGIGETSPPKFAGGRTIQLDRTFTFNNGSDAIFLSTVFTATTQVSADGGGGINYFNGTWKITGGSGAFAGLSGQGSLTNAIGSNSSLPPPPEYAREELVGTVTGGQEALNFRTPPK